jgi:hypothetical protein
MMNEHPFSVRPSPRFCVFFPFLVAVSRCRFSLPFLLPLLVAVLQSKITVQYNGEW